MSRFRMASKQHFRMTSARVAEVSDKKFGSFRVFSDFYRNEQRPWAPADSSTLVAFDADHLSRPCPTSSAIVIREGRCNRKISASLLGRWSYSN